MSSTDYTNAAQQRVLKTLALLCGHEVFGLMPSEIAKGVGTSASNVTRDLANLREAGFAEQIDSGRWRVTPRVGQLFLRVLNALNAARDRVEETHQRFVTHR